VNIADIPAVVLAGGYATRMRPITETIPKALIEVAGKPFIDHQLALLQRNGIRHVVLCLGYLGEQVQSHLGDGFAYGLTISYSYDGARLLGTGGALRRAAHLLGEACWVLYGDSYLEIDYRAVMEQFASSVALGLMTILRNENRWDRSNVIFRDGQLICYDKSQLVPEMEYIDYGASLLRREAWMRIPPNETIDLSDLYHTLVEEGQMVGHVVTRRFYEIGSPAGLAETRGYLEGMVR
jgi:NDP-sugar pyrophosphorylase family protein